MMTDLVTMVAETAAAAPQGGVAGSLTLAIAGAGSAIAVGMIGSKAAEAVGRNPTAFGNILTIGIIGMALAEAVAIYALIIAFQGR
jgi:F-type H+-transporting ATPase subunit c